MGKADTTLFMKKKGDDIIVVQIYVDDIIFGATNESLCEEFSKCMHIEFEMSDGRIEFLLRTSNQTIQRRDLHQPIKIYQESPQEV